MIFNNSDSKRREKCKDFSQYKCNPRTVKECCDKTCEIVCKSICKSHCQPESTSLLACCKPGCSNMKPCLKCTRSGVIPTKTADKKKIQCVSSCCPVELLCSTVTPKTCCEEPPADICCEDSLISCEATICIDSSSAPIMIENPKLCRSLKQCPCDLCKNVRFKDKCEIIPPCYSDSVLCSTCVSSGCMPSQPLCKSRNKCLPTRPCGLSSCHKSYCKAKCNRSNPCGLSDCRNCGVQCKPIKPCCQPGCHKPFCTPECTPENPCQLSDCSNKSCRPKCLPSRPCCHQSCTKSYCKPKCCPSSPCCQPECSLSFCTLKCTASKPCMKTNCKKSYCGLEECEKKKYEPEFEQISPTLNRTNTFAIPNYWQNEVQCSGCGNANCSNSLLMYKQSYPPPCKRSRQNINHPEYY